MEPSAKPLYLSIVLILHFFACCAGFLVPHIEPPDYSNLVYKSCTNQTLRDPIHYSYSADTLSSLLRILTTKSLHSSFFKGSTAGDNGTRVFGLFQCRGDLSTADCHKCVSRLPGLSKSLCGESLGARVQLSGCCIQYEADGVGAAETPELLYKVCSTETAEARGSSRGFEEMRDEAFAAVEMGFTGDARFYHHSINNGEGDLMAQCRRDVEICECGECVSSAVQVAQEQCRSSVSGQIYMAKCYLGYNFYSNPVPSHHEKNNQTSSAAKTVAILVGASAALVFGFLFLKLIKSWVKRDDDI